MSSFRFVPSLTTALFKRLSAFLLVLVLGALALPTGAQAQTFLNFSGPAALVSGVDRQQGAQYRYSAVLPGIDALVTLAQFSGTTALLTNLDDNAAQAPRFQPVITCADNAVASRTCFVRFDFNFVATGTATPALLYGLVVSAQDVDGNGVANGARELIEFTAASSVTLGTTTTTLVAGAPVAGGVQYQQALSTNVQTGIGTGNQYEVYAHYTTALSSLSVIGGNIIGTAGCVSTNTACQRQNSYTFFPVDSDVPSLTVRKISNGGTGTFTFTGNNGWATQPVATSAPATAATSQSEALLNANTATTLNESATSGFTLESIVCTGLGTGAASYTVNGTSGGSVLLNAAATAAGNDIVCTFTNRKLAANLSVTKTNGAAGVVAGSTTAYTITAANNGPDAAPGASVQDTASAGLNCTAVTCAATSANVCPAASFPFSSLSAGITLGPSFPAASTATLTVTCGVTATGQ